MFINNILICFIATGATFALMIGNISIQTYFDVHRNKANGIAMAISAIGLVISPIYITILQQLFDPDGAMLILAAFAMNGFISAVLLQPVKWHMKTIRVENNIELLERNETEIEIHRIQDNHQFGQNIITKWLVDNFDLTLLKDKTVRNTIIGISLVDYAELNYFMIVPFILDDLKYNTIEVATLMSINGMVEIIFRFLSPFIGDYFGQKSRPMFIYRVWEFFLLLEWQFNILPDIRKQCWLVFFWV